MTYLISIAVAGMAGGLAAVFVRVWISEPVAFGVGFLVMSLSLYPLDRAAAREAGRSFSLPRFLLASAAGAGFVVAVSYLIPWWK